MVGKGVIRKDFIKKSHEVDRKSIDDNNISASQKIAYNELRRIIKKILETEGSPILINEKTKKYIRNLMNQLHIVDLSEMKLDGLYNENKWNELQTIMKEYIRSKKKPLDRLSKALIIYIVTAFSMTLLGISGTLIYNVKKKHDMIKKMNEQFLIDPNITRDLFIKTYMDIYKRKIDDMDSENYIKLKPTLFQVEDYET